MIKKGKRFIASHHRRGDKEWQIGRQKSAEKHYQERTGSVREREDRNRKIRGEIGRSIDNCEIILALVIYIG